MDSVCFCSVSSFFRSWDTLKRLFSLERRLLALASPTLSEEANGVIINQLRERKGLEPLDVVFHYFEHKNAAYNRLADIVEEHLDMDYIMSTLG